MFFAFDLAISLFASLWLVSMARRSDLASKRRRMCKSTGKKLPQMVTSGVPAKGLFAWRLMLRVAKHGWGSTPPLTSPVRANGFYIIFMPPHKDESFGEYATWAMDMANVLDCEIGWFFCEALATAAPGETMATVYWRWAERYAGVGE